VFASPCQPGGDDGVAMAEDTDLVITPILWIFKGRGWEGRQGEQGARGHGLPDGGEPSSDDRGASPGA
jgi:hypothetical protein